MKVSSIKSDIEYVTNVIAVSLCNTYKWLQNARNAEIY